MTSTLHRSFLHSAIALALTWSFASAASAQAVAGVDTLRVELTDKSEVDLPALCAQLVNQAKDGPWGAKAEAAGKKVWDNGFKYRNFNTRCVKDPKTCTAATYEDGTLIGCVAYYEGRSCSEARAQRSLPTAARTGLESFYADQSPDDYSCESTLVRGFTGSAIVRWRSKRNTWGIAPKFVQYIQILPSVSIGIPAYVKGPNDVRAALGGVSVIGGGLLRYSPLSGYLALNGFVGTTTVSANSNLNRTDASGEAIYPNPVLLLAGLGLDFFGGVLQAEYAYVALRPDGLTSETKKHGGMVLLNIDLTALAVNSGVSAANAAK